ncbi:MULTISPECIES: cupin domain-containing protein [Candidatus Nitrosocaldus]|jgi:mannose-6-phosphate isomerase-like protein (cupin superfamily)|uniref:Cupin 2 conserved barrel domain protein n=1 Tax=Candidatus Nitrosocaldus cavascurensis TaxID=2058097 RepID=A0A2K5AR52_9ARCH|nr:MULTISPECIES: cupin domain-containing protein [Candidatus Nitrosocaldus]SPC34133.1 Cupin 2 conserved barrel domain protein [Candidatus Nitrosocaldus cavascurensis]
MRTEVYNVNDILDIMSKDGDWCCTFLQSRSMDAGVLRLKPGEDDPQSPHVNDEIYYIIKGDGFITIEGKDIPIKEGSVIFVPAKAKHKFHGNTKELIALYIFAGRDEDITN